MEDGGDTVVADVPDNRTPTILTAGYGDRGFPAFIELLKAHGVTHFVDVRSVPQSSYWEDFRRPNLQRLVPETGLRYVWMGDTLGGVPDSPILCKEPGKVSLEGLDETPEFRLGLDRLLKAAAGEDRVLCLICGCKRPHRCHRARLIAPAIVRAGANVVHIDERGELKDQAIVADEERGFQPELF
ncbi:DUF488 domain-containing protein [bacterium]|nr:MAG: DUF488 domain-containing protein [bacterium]